MLPNGFVVCNTDTARMMLFRLCMCVCVCCVSVLISLTATVDSFSLCVCTYAQFEDINLNILFSPYLVQPNRFQPAGTCN